MNKILSTSLIFFLLGSAVFLVGRSFRVSKVPHGSKFSCNTCHTNGGGSPLNAFGLDVNSRVTPNGSENFWTATFAALDSDGDGFTNGEELQDPSGEWREGGDSPGDVNLVTNPGNANSTPTSIQDGNNIFTFSLENNYPNPFNPSTVIRYEIGERRIVILKVYNSVGEEVSTLVNKMQNAGIYEVQFNGVGLSSGIYLYRLQVGASAGSPAITKTKKMTLLK